MADLISDYIARHPDWSKQMTDIKRVFEGLPLEATIKWGAPCYTYEGKNVVGMVGFKKHMAVWFHQGALLHDVAGVLINAQEGKTQAQRQWRFGSGEKIPRPKLKAYTEEAIRLAKDGKSIKPRRHDALAIPEELQAAVDQDKKLAKAFGLLKPGIQREYADYIRDAKQAATRERRLLKIVPMILAGQGLNDKYR